MNYPQKQCPRNRVQRRGLKVAAFAAFLLASTPGLAADVGLSIQIGQPGFYGEIHLGDTYPIPELVYPNPTIIYTPPNVVHQPIYLHAPHKHIKNWRRYCSQYRACDRPVYFVGEQWYNDVYVPHYHQHGVPQHRHYDEPRHLHHETDRHYPERRHYDSYRRYEHDRDHDDRDDDRHDKHRYRDKHDDGHRDDYRGKEHRHDYRDKDHRYDHKKHDSHDRGRGRKHDD